MVSAHHTPTQQIVDQTNHYSTTTETSIFGSIIGYTIATIIFCLFIVIITSPARKRKKRSAILEEGKRKIANLAVQQDLIKILFRVSERQHDTQSPFNIDEVSAILKPNSVPWLDIETKIINFNCVFAEIPLVDAADDYSTRVNAALAEYNKNVSALNEWCKVQLPIIVKLINSYAQKSVEAVISRINWIINNIDFPNSIPKIWATNFTVEESIAIVEFKLPDVVHNQVYKIVNKTSRPLNQTETKDLVPNIHPAIMLRMAFEIFYNDTTEIIKLLVLNGWVEFDDPATGHRVKVFTTSLMVNRDQILGLNLTKLDSVSAFINLKGKSAGRLIEIVPITPQITLDRKDKRFINTKEVLNNLDTQTNLASMDWQDFESLIAELFQKEFAKEGVEVKVTQASRDRGVDAVIFDPDPIKGGKFIVQAKRYTNTVDVSAVRDLCAVVKKEGASRGILVTTSSYGRDAYTFAQNEPITLLNGAQLLGLLQKHGYGFRINIDEARSHK